MLNYTDLSNTSETHIKKTLNVFNKISIIIPYVTRESEIYISNVLNIVLTSINKINLINFLEYCLKEIILNASKANTKRIYFKKLGINIENDKKYESVMKNFKTEVLGDFDKYEKLHIDYEYFIKIDFKLLDNILFMEILNNSRICKQEEKRLFFRLKNAKSFNSMEEVLTYGFDETEGAGFGIIIAVLMLRKMGLDEKVLNFKKGKNLTSVSIKIPLNLISKEQGIFIAKEITSEIDKMPQFPDNILKIQTHLNNPNCDYISISELIKKDPSITSEIIRIANSPIYMLPNKTKDVVSAVKMIGLNGIKNLIFSLGVNKILTKYYDKDKIDEIMKHSYKVAVFSTQILKYKKLNKFIDDTYVSSLLHDLGKIIINTLKPELLKKLHDLCYKKSIPISTIEDITKGYNHSIIGGLLAEKWNFPVKLTNSIKLHHVPLEDETDDKLITYTVYLSNELYYFEIKKRKFKDINYKILKYFELDKENIFIDFTDSIFNNINHFV